MIDISIVIPVYNGEKFISDNVKFIINYNNTDLLTEIILVNDGSTDNSLDVLNELKLEYDFIRIINQENKGAGGARNAGLKVAVGERIWFIDADDIIEPQSFKFICDAIKISKEDTIIFNYNRIINNQVKFNNIDNLKYEESIVLNYLDFNKRDLPCYLWIVLYKTHIIRDYDISFIDNIKNLEDLEFNLKYFPKTKSILFVNKPIYNYVLNTTSTTQNRSKDNLIKLANDSFTVHISIYRKYIKEKDVCLKDYYLYNLLITQIGFFYTLLSSEYIYSDVKKYFKLYKHSGLLPILKHNNLPTKYKYFSKIINLGIIPFFIFKKIFSIRL